MACPQILASSCRASVSMGIPPPMRPLELPLVVTKILLSVILIIFYNTSAL